MPSEASISGEMLARPAHFRYTGRCACVTGITLMIAIVVKVISYHKIPRQSEWWGKVGFYRKCRTNIVSVAKSHRETPSVTQTCVKLGGNVGLVRKMPFAIRPSGG